MKNVGRTRVVQGPYNQACGAERQGLYDGPPQRGGGPSRTTYPPALGAVQGSGLVWIETPDGSPDWPAINDLARKTALVVLAQHAELVGEALLVECRREGGVHPKITARVRRDLVASGLVRTKDAVVRTAAGRRRARLWSLTAQGRAEVERMLGAG